MDSPLASVKLIGNVEDDGKTITIRGRIGSVSIKGSSDELASVRHTIEVLRGGSQPSQAGYDNTTATKGGSLLSALEEIEAVVDLSRAWAWFQRITSIPDTIPLGHDPMTAYDMPRLTVAGQPCDFEVRVEKCVVDEIAARRHSAYLEEMSAEPQASLKAAAHLAMNAYTLRTDGHRPVAAGGALYPLHFWVIGADADESSRRILVLDTDRGTVSQSATITPKECQELFLPDPGVRSALTRGAAVIVIAADSRRVTHKYGNRGWRYAYMECGSVTHHMTLSAAAFGYEIRPYAGFYDEVIQDRIGSQVHPLLTVFVAAS